MTYSKKQKVAVLKSLLYIVDADGIHSNQELSFLRWFSVTNNEELDKLIACTENMSKEEMQETIHNLDEATCKEVSKMWYVCSLSDGIVPEELQVIIDLANRGKEPERKEVLTKERIHYIIDTYDCEEAPQLPSVDFLNRYNETDLHLDSRELEDQFFGCEMLFETIDIYGFSHEEFWLLVLFVKDVVEEKCKSAIAMPEQTIDEIRRIKNAIYLIAHACEHLINEHTFHSMRTKLDEVDIPRTKRLAMFYVVMMRFQKIKSTILNLRLVDVIRTYL